MNFIECNIHKEAVPQKVKDLLRRRQFGEAILASVNFYQEYDMIESMKLILSDISKDHSLTPDNKLSILSQLFDIIVLFYPTSTVGKMGKTNYFCLLTLEAQKYSKEICLLYCRNAVSSLFSLFTVDKIGKEKRASIFKEILSLYKKINLYSKKGDSINDPITNSLIEKLRINYELPKGILLPRKPFLI